MTTSLADELAALAADAPEPVVLQAIEIATIALRRLAVRALVGRRVKLIDDDAPATITGVTYDANGAFLCELTFIEEGGDPPVTYGGRHLLGALRLIPAGA